MLSADCDPPCVNGACIGTNICTCYEGWTGDICDNQGIINTGKIFQIQRIGKDQFSDIYWKMYCTNNVLLL